jgi:hypothetical protein
MGQAETFAFFGLLNLEATVHLLTICCSQILQVTEFTGAQLTGKKHNHFKHNVIAVTANLNMSSDM